MRSLLIGVFFIFSMSSCIKWELDRKEIASFNNEIADGEQIEFQYKNDFLQKNNEEYILVGMTLDSSVLISKVSDSGILLDKKKDFGNGEGHRIIQGPNETSFLLTSTDQKAYLFELDEGEEVIRIDSISIFADRKIGLIKEVRFLDLFVSEDGDFWVSGFLQQNFGDRRLALMKLDHQRNLRWIKTYSEGHIGYAMTQLNNGFLAILNEKANSKYLTFIDDQGVFKWQRRIATDLQKVALNVIPIDTMAVTSLNANNELSIIGFDRLENRVLNIPINNAGYLLPQYLTVNRFGNFVLVAVSADVREDSGVYLLEVNQSGDILWQQYFQPNADVAYHPLKVQQVKDLGYCIFGISSKPSGQSSYFMIKTDEEGVLRN